MELFPETAAPTGRREREREARRVAMLDAALDVFAERGFEQATVEEVAARAEFGKGTLYNYFPGGKDAILVALFDRMYGRMNALIREYLNEGPGAAQPARNVFGGLVDELLTYFTENEAAFRVLMKEAHRVMLSSDVEKVERLMEHRDRSITAMVPAIERAIAAGELKPYPAKAVAHMIMGNVHGYLMYALSTAACAPGPPAIWPPTDEAAAFITSVLFDGLVVRD